MKSCLFEMDCRTGGRARNYLRAAEDGEMQASAKILDRHGVTPYLSTIRSHYVCKGVIYSNMCSTLCECVWRASLRK